jgi:CDP-glucose 4,6-dehydratase
VTNKVFNGVYRNKKVLITGDTSFKGSWLSRWLLDLGARVYGLAIDVPSQPNHFELLDLASSIKHYQADIRVLSQIQAIFDDVQPDFVFHLAAQALVRESYAEPKLTFDTNVGGTVNVLECVRATPSIQSAVFVATDKCYENKEWIYGYREIDPLGGHDPYSASKACAELAFSAYAKSFFLSKARTRMASARAGNVIGGGDWAKDRLIPDCVRAWSRGEAVRIRNPHSTRPWQHVLEPLSAYLALGAALVTNPDQTHGESFNFGPQSTAERSVSDVVRSMERTWSSSRFTVESERNESLKEAKLLKLSCEKSRELLKWEPTLSFDEGVEWTAQWYKSYYQSEHAPQSGSIATLTLQQIHEYQTLATGRDRAWARTL